MRRVILAICATAAVLALLLSFKTHTQPRIGSSPAAAVGTPTPGAGTATPDAASSTGTSAGTGSQAAGAAKTVTGAAWPTPYGPVQLQVTVTAGKVTAVKVLQYPDGTPRDAEINAYAIPRLNSETLAAGNASIDSVSGATYTSQGYIGSLQNALDKAKSS